jgi:hypothetical protein
MNNKRKMKKKKEISCVSIHSKDQSEKEIKRVILLKIALNIYNPFLNT